MCRTKHFIKGLKNEMEVEKATAHRKKIQQKGEKTEAKRSKLAIADIVKDNSEGKQVSHRIIVGNIAKNVDYLSLYVISELHLLLRAYSITFKKSSRKEKLVSILKEKIMNANDVHMMVNSGVLTASTSTPSGTGDDALGIGQKRPHNDE